MARPPSPDPGDVHGAVEVALVLRLGEPAGLAGGLARRSAGRGRAVTLVTAVARVAVRTGRSPAQSVAGSMVPSRPVPGRPRGAAASRGPAPMARTAEGSREEARSTEGHGRASQDLGR